MIIFLLAVSFVTYLLYSWKIKKDLPPGPWCLPIIGYLPFLDPKAPHVTLTQLSKRYGPIYGLNLGSVYTVVLTNSKTIRKVFAEDVSTGRAPLYLTHGIMKGYGLICAEGDIWKDQRRFVHNCLRQFGGSKIGNKRENMGSLITTHVIDFVNFIKDKGHSVEIDPLDSLRHSLGSAINMIVFGKSWSRDDPTWQWLQHLQEEGTKHIGVAGPLNFLPFLSYIPKFRQTLDFLIEGKIKTHKVYQEIIDEQSKLLDPNCIDNLLHAFLIEKEKKKDNVDIAKFYNDQQFYHLLADIFGAGLDTTLTTLRWFLLYMATNEIIQTKARTEINEVIQHRYPTLEDMSLLPYIEASILETQRIRPVVPVGIPHGSLDNMEVSGYLIPKNTMIIPLQWALHMDEDVFEDPDNFKPERFLTEDSKIIKDDSFMPFQAGKRMCVGDELARMLLFLFGATILQNFVLKVSNDDRIDLNGDCGITLTPKPQNIIFEKINVEI